MKSRRRIALSKALDCVDYRSQRILQQGFAVMKWVLGVSLRGSNPEPPMSTLGHKRTLRGVRSMSALTLKADFAQPPVAGHQFIELRYG